VRISLSKVPVRRLAINRNKPSEALHALQKDRKLSNMTVVPHSPDNASIPIKRKKKYLASNEDIPTG
jgi:hypothetical protein